MIKITSRYTLVNRKEANLGDININFLDTLTISRRHLFSFHKLFFYFSLAKVGLELPHHAHKAQFTCTINIKAPEQMIEK